MRTMKGLGALAVATLVAVTFLSTAAGAWAFAALEFAFLAWLANERRRVDSAALLGRNALEADEADIVRRYPLYFARPALARECASTLSAIGLATLVLVPWLTYRLQWAQAILIGVMLFAVARMTKLMSPVYALRLATAKGDRDALRLLSAHDGAMRKLSVDQPETQGEGGR
jgi:hypothetical protein